MKSFAVLALAGAVAAIPAAVKTPTGSAPAGCSTNYAGSFEISVANLTSSSKRDVVQKRKALTATLSNGVLTDDEGRTGEIVANYQFQFDPVIQAGAIYTGGWSVCSNGTLALGSSAVFYQCLSGTFYNLYDESTGAQCNPVFINVIGTGATVSTQADGQPTAASAPAVSQITDGQLQATTAVVSQISDGQIQATTGTAHVVTQISDGQIQATTGAHVVTQISDGQIQATTGTAHVVTQISDGQIQATTGAAVVTQISDGQIQATAGTSVKAANGTSVATASPSIATYTGAAAIPTLRSEIFGLAAGVLALAML
ncbi:hypothetical protein MBLNU459_g0858t1 [Dothideomycetes sp. NU459]